MFKRPVRLPGHLAALLVVWTLVLALPIYGCSGVLLQILGPVHRHAGAAPPMPVTSLAGISDAVHWLADQWSRWQQFAAERTRTGQWHGHLHAAEAAHAHHGFDRHHHTPGDDLIALGAQDPDGGLAGDLGASAGSGSATLPLALAGAVCIAAASGHYRRRLFAAPPSWRSVAPRRLERPPRHGR